MNISLHEASQIYWPPELLVKPNEELADGVKALPVRIDWLRNSTFSRSTTVNDSLSFPIHLHYAGEE
jgi:hypothetical protein